MNKILAQTSSVITEFAELMAKINNLCLEFNENETEEHIKQFINSLSTKFFHEIDSYFEHLWSLMKSLSDNDYRKVQSEIDSTLLKYFYTPPLNQRIIDKPLGYDGDYITISYYYENSYDGDTIYDIFIHRYTLHIPIAQAVYNRFRYFYNEIVALSKRGSRNAPMKITSLGCGPAKEILKYANNNNDQLIEFYCVDSDMGAIQQLNSEIDNIAIRQNYRPKITPMLMNILNIIKSAKKMPALTNQDLIYASGLFDYLDDKVAKSLIKTMYSLLNERGTIIITNFHKRSPSRSYLENIGRWPLIYRDEDDMLKLCSYLQDPTVTVTTDKETKTNMFLRITKK